MRYKTILFHIIIWLSCISLFESCSSSDCPLTNVVRCYYTIYSSEQGIPLAYNDTLTILAADTILLNQAVKVTSFSLPMSYALPADTLTFHFKTSKGNNTTATVCVSHTNKAYFVSLDCPTSYFHNISTVEYQTSNTIPNIDSIVVVKPEVNYERKENIRIYLSNF